MIRPTDEDLAIHKRNALRFGDFYWRYFTAASWISIHLVKLWPKRRSMLI